MIEHIKKFWKQYVVGSVIAPTAFAAGLVVGNGKPGEIDCKGTDCQIQVIIDKPNYKDALYYEPDEWDTKTEADLAAEEDARYNNWKQFIEAQSQATSTPIEVINPDDQISP